MVEMSHDTRLKYDLMRMVVSKMVHVLVVTGKGIKKN